MATKKVSYITLLKEAMKTVQEFDSNQLDIVQPQIKPVLDYDGKAEMKTSEKADASSILERYYFKEENDMDELEDEIAGEEGTEGTLEECDVKKEQEEKDEEEKKDEEEPEEKEVMEAYRLFKEQEVAQSTEEAGTKKDMPLAKEPAAEVGDKDITPNKEAGTLKEQDDEEEKKEEEDEVPETEIEEQEEKEEGEEEEEEEEEDAEKAVVEKLIAELEEEPEEEKGEEEKKEEEEDKPEDEKKVEGLAGALGGGALGASVGGVPGAIVGGAAGHLAQKKFLKDQEEKKDEEEKGEEEEKDEEPLDVDKKLKEALPALPRAMANKNTEFQEAKLIKEAQEAIKYFLEEEEEEISSKKDVTV